MSTEVQGGYRGRIAPSPTGYLHLGHGRTFWIAWERARKVGGTVVLRNDDLDRDRVRTEFITGFIEDLKWLGVEWDEGPDRGGPHRPYSQSERMSHYAAALSRLRDLGWVYPCTCSRREILASLSAPHAGDEEPVGEGTAVPLAVPDRDALPDAVPEADDDREPEGVPLEVGDEDPEALNDLAEDALALAEGLPLAEPEPDCDREGGAV